MKIFTSFAEIFSIFPKKGNRSILLNYTRLYTKYLFAPDLGIILSFWVPRTDSVYVNPELK